ncbi:MAG TPA: dihydroorotate dehydrogenase electron transfer subunit [Syntrophorhabdaceae bacterium]|nr:dihydroorotate dehydrogenase electron transfer subunit [Syntrophorhabdaceae bacterium]
MDDIEARILTNENIIKDYFLLRLKLSKPLGKVVPGQFVMLKIPKSSVFLRRPFSIYAYRRGVMTIMYKLKGKGTMDLAKAIKGDITYVLGPLGKGFHIKTSGENLVVAGGIGIAGVHMLLERLKNRACLFFGCADHKEVVLTERLYLKGIHISTLDGSFGFKGNITDMLRGYLENHNNIQDIQVYACGPEGMIKSLRDVLEKDRIPCQVLLEERMACGLGLCFGCVKRTLDEKEPYKRVCREGPVFHIWQICL